jgi:hypothetical protein
MVNSGAVSIKDNVKRENVTRVGFLQKIRALARQMVSRPAQGAGTRAAFGPPTSEEQSSGPDDVNVIPAASQASALSPAEPGDRDEAARLSLPPQPETLGPPSALNVSVEVLVEQMLTLVEVAAAREKELKALKAQAQQLEEHDQAIMVAFTTFFHVLTDKRVARLEEIAALLHRIIAMAEREAYPTGSVQLLQRLATMLQEQSGAPVGEGQESRPRDVGTEAAGARARRPPDAA